VPDLPATAGTAEIGVVERGRIGFMMNLQLAMDNSALDNSALERTEHCNNTAAPRSWADQGFGREGVIKNPLPFASDLFL
jgi:hypothetical protein